MSRRYAFAAFAGVVGLAVFGSAPGAARQPLHVCASGCAYSTIQAAVDAATAGSTIVVEAGTYTGGVTISTGIRLLGAGAAKTVIDGGGPAVYVPGGVTAVLSGLTVTGGVAAFGGGGLNVQPGSVVLLRDSIVTGNSAGREGGGIDNVGELTLKNVTISGNHAGGNGGGITNGGTLTVVDSRVTSNSADYGAGIANFETAALIDSKVVQNTASLYGGGIWTAPFATLTLRDSEVLDNVPDDICSQNSC